MPASLDERLRIGAESAAPSKRMVHAPSLTDRLAALGPTYFLSLNRDQTARKCSSLESPSHSNPTDSVQTIWIPQ